METKDSIYVLATGRMKWPWSHLGGGTLTNKILIGMKVMQYEWEEIT